MSTEKIAKFSLHSLFFFTAKLHIYPTKIYHLIKMFYIICLLIEKKMNNLMEGRFTDAAQSLFNSRFRVD